MQKRLTNQKIKAAFSFDKTAPFSFFLAKKKKKPKNIIYSILLSKPYLESQCPHNITCSKWNILDKTLENKASHFISRHADLEQILGAQRKWHAAKVQGHLNKLKWWALSIRKWLPTQESMVTLIILVVRVMSQCFWSPSFKQELIINKQCTRWKYITYSHLEFYINRAWSFTPMTPALRRWGAVG